MNARRMSAFARNPTRVLQLQKEPDGTEKFSDSIQAVHAQICKLADLHKCDSPGMYSTNIKRLFDMRTSQEKSVYLYVAPPPHIFLAC